MTLRRYPAALVFTAYGLAFTRSSPWPLLHAFLSTELKRGEDNALRLVDVLGRDFSGSVGDDFKSLQGHEKEYTPYSNHLFQLSSQWSPRFVGLTNDFELLFSRFEWLSALACYERFSGADLQRGLGSGLAAFGTWVPVGRAGWNRRLSSVLLPELQAEPMKTALLQAGFVNGVSTSFDLSIENIKHTVAAYGWR